jgi:Cu+-exporting ATPase
MLSGDERSNCEALAATLSIDQVHARCSPSEKASTIAAWQASGEVVAFVGDGINDAPAIAHADVGIAFGTGSGLANQAAAVQILAGHGLDVVVAALGLARRCLRIVRQNLFWAFFYNMLLIPVAAGVFFPRWGVRLTPAWASAAMGVSSLIVVVNSLRLRHIEPNAAFDG